MSEHQKERNLEIIQQHDKGVSLAQLAKQHGISRTRVHTIIRQTAERLVAPDVQALRDRELARLEYLRAEVNDVIARRHAVLHQGSDTGFDDDGVVLDAIRTDVRLSESMRKLLGVDMPVRVDASTSVRFELIGIDPEVFK